MNTNRKIINLLQKANTLQSYFPDFFTFNESRVVKRVSQVHSSLAQKMLIPIK